MERLRVQAMIKWVPLCALLLLGNAELAQLPAVTVKGRVVVLSSVENKKKPSDSGVVVWLTPIPRSSVQSFKPVPLESRQRFRLVQKNKRFDPHVLVVQVGSVVDFPNLDPFFHNVFSLFEGKRFDLGLYESGTSRATVFDRPGICYVFCNIHPEMSAVILVLDTPYFGVSNSAGEISIFDVPSGRYQLHVWNERSTPEALKGLRREITLTEETANLGTLPMTESRKLVLPHKNKYGRDYDEPQPMIPGYEPGR
jgi:hypothetical protein